MTTCPPREQFLRLLQGSLEDREERLLEAHLKSCPDCVKTLEELTAVSPQEFREAGVPSLPPLSGQRTDPGSGTATAGHPLSAEFLLRLQERLRSSTIPGKVTSEESRAGAAGESLPRIEGYRVLGVLGRGGMGVVYKAEQLALGRLVALKMIRGGFVAETGSRSRFRTEVMAIAQLQHPHIVQIFEVGEAEDLPYYALEYVEGGSLADRLVGVPQPPRHAAELVERVARAVHFAHEHGIIHRDLKPGNILLTAEGAPKVADFGLAKQLDGTAGQSRTGEVLGTPSYMAPEQLNPDASGIRPPLGPACDIYALGAILYELLTGRQLYAGDTPLNVLVRVLHEDPTPPRVYRPELPRDLETICLKCLAKAPGGRYATARDLADDLHRFLVGEPVRARPPSLLYRSGKFVQRHKHLVGAAAGIALALTAGIVATSLTALSEAHQRRLADQNAHQAEVARQEAVREAYQARMAAALAALGDHNVREAAEQLQAVPEDQQGWEWRYAAAQLNDSLTVLRDIGRGPVPCATRACFASFTDEGICLWDVPSGRRRAALPCEVAYSFGVATTSTGVLLLTAYEPSGLVRVLAEDGGVRQRLTLPGKGGLHAWAIDRSGTRLACAWLPVRNNARFALFDLTTGRQLVEFARFGTEIRCLGFSPDGRRLVSGSDDGRVRVWDTARGSCEQSLEGHTGFINSVEFRPDGRCVLSCSMDQSFRQWDLASGRVVDERYGHVDGVNRAAYSPDGRWIASAGADGTIRYWDAAGGPAVAVLHGHTAPVLCLEFSPDGRRVYTVARNEEARVWEGPDCGNPRILRDHTFFVYPVAYSPDGRTLASGAWDRVIRLRDAASGETLRVLRGHDQYIASLAFSPDSRRLVSRGADQTVRIWDVETGKLLATLQRGGVDLPNAPHNAAITPDGTHVACPVGNKLYLWDMTAGREAGTLPLPMPSRAVQFSPDGGRLAVVGNGPDIAILNAATGALQLRLQGHRNCVNMVAFSPDGARLVSGGDDRAVRLWDAISGECLRVLRGHTDEVFAIVFHPDGSRIASAGRDRVIRIWDPASGAELARLPGHTNYVFSLAFSPDGTTLVSGSGDYSVRFWDTFPVARRLQARALFLSRPDR